MVRDGASLRRVRRSKAPGLSERRRRTGGENGNSLEELEEDMVGGSYTQRMTRMMTWWGNDLTQHSELIAIQTRHSKWLFFTLFSEAMFRAIVVQVHAELSGALQVIV